MDDNTNAPGPMCACPMCEYNLRLGRALVGRVIQREIEANPGAATRLRAPQVVALYYVWKALLMASWRHDPAEIMPLGIFMPLVAASLRARDEDFEFARNEVKAGDGAEIVAEIEEWLCGGPDE